MHLEENEKVVQEFEVKDLEFGSFMATEHAKVVELGKQISKAKDKISLLLAQNQFISGSMWNAFFDKYPEMHPSNFETGVDRCNYDPEEHKVYMVKFTGQRQGE